MKKSIIAAFAAAIALSWAVRAGAEGFALNAMGPAEVAAAAAAPAWETLRTQPMTLEEFAARYGTTPGYLVSLFEIDDIALRLKQYGTEQRLKITMPDSEYDSVPMGSALLRTQYQVLRRCLETVAAGNPGLARNLYAVQLTQRRLDTQDAGLSCTMNGYQGVPCSIRLGVSATVQGCVDLVTLNYLAPKK